MTPDIEKYRRFVDHYDLTEAQKVELIHSVWAIMESFVDRAFGLDSVQISAQVLRNRDSIRNADILESRETTNPNRF